MIWLLQQSETNQVGTFQSFRYKIPLSARKHCPGKYEGGDFVLKILQLWKIITWLNLYYLELNFRMCFCTERGFCPTSLTLESHQEGISSQPVWTGGMITVTVNSSYVHAHMGLWVLHEGIFDLNSSLKDVLGTSEETHTVHIETGGYIMQSEVNIFSH